MGATRRFIRASVGAKGVNNARDVRHLQDLLIAAGFAVQGGADGRWGEATQQALAAAVKQLPTGTASTPGLVHPDAYLLVYLAWKANLLIPMPGQAGMPGVLAMHRHFVERRVRYNAGAEKGEGNRAVWGVHERPDLAVQTTSGRFHAGPVEMDCTTYVNLMLSIYACGHCHAEPYAASCAAFGGVSSTHCARDRFGMPLVTRTVAAGAGRSTEARHFESAQQIADAVGARKGKLFALEVATAATCKVTHMALLHGGTVYECTTGQSGSACIARPLADFCAAKTGKIYYLFGPNLATR